MAVVYLARQISKHRLVAVKELKKESLLDDEYIRRFFREARITAQLAHPNIITIIESNYQNERCYIVTEYVDGGDLRPLVYDPKVSLARKLRIMNKIIHALDYAHRQGIVHRDIKPSNILLSKKLEPKLCDFGIATALWGQESRLTRTTEMMGTMDYIAPEQKESSKNVDFRADIYSVGVILYQLITGMKPMGAFEAPAELNPRIPLRLDACVIKCLQPAPIKRFKSTEALYHEIKDCLAEMEASAKQPTSGANLSGINRKRAVTSPTGRRQPLDSKEKDTVIGTARAGENQPTEKLADFDELVEKLKDGTLSQKLSCKSLLIESARPHHGQRLLELLRQSDGFLKEAVIEILGKLKIKESCPYLIELLNEPYYNKAVARAIGEIGCAEAEFKLFNILVSESANSYVALLPLGKLNSAKSVDTMAKFLQSPHVWIRETALDALAMITPTAQSVPYIEEASRRDENAQIRAKAKKILWRSGQ
ncbi:MAG: protein kinase [bacterium]|nr:protein kinase [bacterium]